VNKANKRRTYQLNPRKNGL